MSNYKILVESRFRLIDYEKYIYRSLNPGFTIYAKLCNETFKYSLNIWQMNVYIKCQEFTYSVDYATLYLISTLS